MKKIENIINPHLFTFFRSLSTDVADAMSLASLEGLEDRFSNQAAIK